MLSAPFVIILLAESPPTLRPFTIGGLPLRFSDADHVEHLNPILGRGTQALNLINLGHGDIIIDGYACAHGGNMCNYGSTRVDGWCASRRGRLHGKNFTTDSFRLEVVEIVRFRRHSSLTFLSPPFPSIITIKTVAVTRFADQPAFDKILKRCRPFWSKSKTHNRPGAAIEAHLWFWTCWKNMTRRHSVVVER